MKLLLPGLLLLLCTAPLQAALPLSVDGQPLPSLAPMLEQISPAVVNIATYTTVQVRNPLLEDPFFRRFFRVPEGRRQFRRTQSAGSGVVVNARKGYIVTNSHVVDRADEIAVTLADGRLLTAELLGSDAQVDLALLKVDPEQLNEIEFADSAALRVGDFVVAIGNPFGLNQTVTSGIVSALGRSGLGIEGYEDFIQTDASINPGNSGGALINSHGELVGINTAVLAQDPGTEGIGFAIPVDLVRGVVDQIKQHGRVVRGYMGLLPDDLTDSERLARGIESGNGILLTAVYAGGPAAAADLQVGDVILELNGEPVYSQRQALLISASTRPGDIVDVVALRDGERFSTTVTAVERPDDPQ